MHMLFLVEARKAIRNVSIYHGSVILTLTETMLDWAVPAISRKEQHLLVAVLIQSFAGWRASVLGRSCAVDQLEAPRYFDGHQ